MASHRLYTSTIIAFAVALVSVLLVSQPAGAAERTIYRTTDANGRPVFTDVPPRNKDDAQTIVLQVEDANTYQATSARTPYEGRAEANQNAASNLYSSISIVSPGDDESIRNNAGNVNIQAEVFPELRRGHQLRLIMDGVLTELVADGTSFQLGNVDRGSHSVAAAVVDRSGTVLTQSPSITFNLMRNSVITNPPRAPSTSN